MKKILMTLMVAFAGLSLQAQNWNVNNYKEVPKDPVYQTEELHIQSAGNDLWGIRFTPKKQGKMPVVILSHGFNGDPILYHLLCNNLAKDGYICYIFDFSGGSKRTRSQGKTTDMSLRTEQQNLTDIINVARSWPEADPDQIFLVGESQGGIVTALTASAMPDKIRAIALMYPAFSIPDGVKRYKGKDINEIPESQEVMTMQIGRRYYADIMDMDVYPEIAKYEKPVLIVHGDKDTLVPLKYSQEAMKYYKNAHLEVMPGAPHGYYQTEPMIVNEKLIHDFLNQQRK